jgi:hypothetical protein
VPAFRQFKLPVPFLSTGRGVEGCTMITDTNPWATAARLVAKLSRHVPPEEPPVPTAVVSDALWVLVWLAGERVAPPHEVSRGDGGVVQFHWHQGRSGFELRVLARGRLSWRADGLGDETPRRTGRKLDHEAAGLLRSLIPLTRPFRPQRERS